MYRPELKFVDWTLMVEVGNFDDVARSIATQPVLHWRIYDLVHLSKLNLRQHRQKKSTFTHSPSRRIATIFNPPGWRPVGLCSTVVTFVSFSFVFHLFLKSERITSAFFGVKAVIYYLLDTVSSITCFLWSPYVIGQTIIFLPCDFNLSSFFFFFFFPRLISAAVDWMSTILPHMVWP